MVNEYPHKVTLQTFTKIDDGYGGYSEEWQDLRVLDAHVQPISGNEYYQAQKMENPLEMDVYTPCSADISSTMRLVYEGRILSIKAVLDLGGMKEVMLLKCSGVSK